MDIFAKITGIKYTPFLCRRLNTYILSKLQEALSRDATFILEIDENNKIAISQWVSPKRTRSYPYARVYDSLSFFGKKLTIIPVIKDEGKRGDRDYLEFDTISLMSLLDIYVIIGYYSNASINSRFENKITDQEFGLDYLKEEINELLSYRSSPLHWNLLQIDKIGEIAREALECYRRISKQLRIEMHSEESAMQRINQLLEGREAFMTLSRDLAKRAQERESITVQPKEKLNGSKAVLTIKNYLGGYYFFTADEVKIDKQNIYLIEGKHTKTNELPSLGDIKDGLLKMILFTNLKDVKVNGIDYTPTSILKLTTGADFNLKSLNKPQIETLNILKQEAEANSFKILLNGRFIKIA